MIHQPTTREIEALTRQKETVELKKAELRAGLPHLYGRKWYAWAKAFFDSKNPVSLLCAANQITKSSTQIRKCIEWAGNPKLWPFIWDMAKLPPRQFWYLYPDKGTSTAEFNLKWKPEFMPAFTYKDHPTYGWKETYGDKRQIFSIVFNSGVTVFFKTYEQDILNLQSGTVHAIFCFVAGTLVLTPRGARCIEDLRVGDEVIAGDGTVQTVRRALSRQAEVITRRFSNGETVTATPDHPFWTKNRGWASFGDLTTSDQCGTVPGWKLIKNWSCLKASFTRATRSMRTLVSAIISEIAALGSSTCHFGSLCISEAFPRGMSSTTSISIHSTTGSKTSNFLRAPSTRAFTKKRSGDLRASGSLSVKDARKTLHREALSAGRLGFARRIAAALAQSASALSAKLLSRLAAKTRSVSVQSSAPIRGDTRVYNLDVSGPSTYFANGILVHNCDEELPEELYSELIARLFDTDGPFNMVFTATRNQNFWKLAIEGDGETETFKDAFKQQISMYDCQTYMDGTPGAYSEEKIGRLMAKCKSDTEIQRRVYGKFVTELGRTYAQFDATKHYKKPFDIPVDWKRYAAVDIGSGGEGHPPAVCFIAVRPDYRLGVVYRGWKGDDGANYTNGDIYMKFVSLRGRDILITQKYDQAAKDFHTISDRNGDTFMPSEKNHERGEDTLNTLFKNDMLYIFDDPELHKLGNELSSLMKSTPKRKAKDDFCDALRYGAVDIPWDWSALKGEKTEDDIKAEMDRPYTDKERVAMEIAERRGEMFDAREKKDEGWEELDQEFADWNEAYGNG